MLCLFLNFNFVEASRMAGVSRRMADRLQETIGCPREHIVFELIHSSVVEDVTIKSGNDWPYVEVDYFERASGGTTRSCESHL